jgi:hypothetical protein
MGGDMGMNVAVDAPAAAAGETLCWICKERKADSGEHKTKRSDLLAVLEKPAQDEPFYFHDLNRRNQPVRSLDAKILKSPNRICASATTPARNLTTAPGSTCRIH